MKKNIVSFILSKFVTVAVVLVVLASFLIVSKNTVKSDDYDVQELYEDTIGLHARAEITDADVVKKARQGDLVGWSFGFTDRDVEETIENGNRVRNVKDLNLYEVSIIDRSKLPCYEGTLVEVRAEGETIFRGEDRQAEVTVVDNTAEDITTEVVEEIINDEPKQQEVVENNTPVEVQEEVDYSTYENAINNMKGD